MPVIAGFEEGLQRLFASGEQLPTLPTVIFRLHSALAREDVSAAEVAAVIESDPALTARLLRAANSAAYARSGDRIAAVPFAIQRLGLNQVRALCLVLSIVNTFGERRRALSHESLWAHSAAVGITARSLWSRFRGDHPLSPDDVYTAGLLHDVGLLVLDQFFTAEYDRVVELSEAMELPLWQHEEDVLGLDHGRIGGMLLEHWSLPAAVAEAVAFHHRPAAAPDSGALVCRIVCAAEAVCSGEGLQLREEGQPDPAAEAALASLGVPESEIAPLLGELRTRAREASGMLV